MKNDSVSVGKEAEIAAKYYLQKQGLTFITQNYRCRQGEIDLIMKEAEQVVFIEVKFRKNNDYGSGLEVVSKHKQQRIIYTARHFLHKYRLEEKVNCRFDIISLSPIITSNSHQTIDFKWLKNAFD